MTEYNSEEHTKKDSPINKWLAENKKPAKKKIPLKVQCNDEATSSTIVADLDFRNSKKVNGFIKPMLAKETDKAFDNKDWLFEIKWDGYRAIAEKNEKEILLYSRNGLSFLTNLSNRSRSIKKDKS